MVPFTNLELQRIFRVLRDSALLLLVCLLLLFFILLLLLPLRVGFLSFMLFLLLVKLLLRVLLLVLLLLVLLLLVLLLLGLLLLVLLLLVYLKYDVSCAVSQAQGLKVILPLSYRILGAKGPQNPHVQGSPMAVPGRLKVSQRSPEQR